MAVVGAHAIALSQCKRDATPISGNAWTLEAARLRSRKTGNKFCWEIVFSTGQHSLESQLLEFVEELSCRTWEGNKLWKRGEVVDLGDGRHGKLVRKWTVWDAGYTTKG